jgi:AcrR family transcriptional regulator
MPKVSEEHLAARRQQILLAAIACFIRTGFDRTTMADIAAEAGVSDTLAYRYFSGKEEIIQAAVREGAGERAHLSTEDFDEDDAAALLDLGINTSFMRFSMPGRDATLRLRLRSWAEAGDSPEVREEVLARWKHSLDLEEVLWSRAQAQRLISPDLEPWAVGRVMQAIHDGLDLQWSLDPGIDTEECRRVVAALVFGSFWQDGESAESDRPMTEGRQ